jgi:archaellum biogenesis ATPase FlaH
MTDEQKPVEEKGAVWEEKLFDPLSPTHTIDLKLQAYLSDLPKSVVLLAIIKTDEYNATNAELMKFFLEKQTPGVFVSINRPLNDVIGDIPESALEKNNLFFIDYVTKISGAEEAKGKNFFYVESPHRLGEISEILGKIIERLPRKESFVLIDSLSTLLVYNKPAIVEKFAHSLSGRMRSWKTKGIFIMVESEKTTHVAETIGQFCDKTVRIE